MSLWTASAVGLCLSGGGYRATLFHAGGVIRLNELGVLPRLSRVSSVSGGSICAGILGMNWSKLKFDADGIATNLGEVFVKPCLDATARTLDIRVSLEGLLPFVSAGNRLSHLYDRFIFNGFKLNALPESPVFVFNATNLQTSGLIRFTRRYIADWRALMCENHQVSLADAVAASSAFPPILSPLRLDLSGETVSTPPGARFSDPELHRQPVLVDGGVYDNLGLEPVWKRCGVVIASYAGFNARAEPSNFDIDHLYPMVMAMLSAGEDWRERILVSLYRRPVVGARRRLLDRRHQTGAFPIHARRTSQGSRHAHAPRSSQPGRPDGGHQCGLCLRRCSATELSIA